MDARQANTTDAYLHTLDHDLIPKAVALGIFHEDSYVVSYLETFSIVRSKTVVYL